MVYQNIICQLLWFFFLFFLYLFLCISIFFLLITFTVFSSLTSLARLAVESGAAGIIVSNHGARQLDYAPATVMALEEVSLLVY